MALTTRPLEIEARDGYRLGATLFAPDAPNGRAASIHPATGVPQEYYGRFAAYLAERGLTVLTWAELDGAVAVGHSFGGQAFGLLPRPERLSAAVVVGSQSGYWRNWPPLGRTWMWAATHLMLPLLSRLLGYFPSSRLGFGEDLPAGVATEWASWCRHPRYLVGALRAEDAYARFAVRALLELYPGARTEMRRVAPREVGARAIGHFGFFREAFRATLWRDAADWLVAQ